MYIFSILIANVANFVQTSVCTVLIIHYHGFACHILECIMDEAVSNSIFIQLKFILKNQPPPYGNCDLFQTVDLR